MSTANDTFNYWFPLLKEVLPSSLLEQVKKTQVTTFLVNRTQPKRMFEKSKTVCFTTLTTEKRLRENLGFGICDHAPESHLRLKQTLFKHPLIYFNNSKTKSYVLSKK
ncbi:hypothetical protein DP116_00155 [Brasilonema bromeliae SPC951]|uniref:Uncharacterized protein n=1 Tax=Brasilonema bromeliae SPC951 TaxID=385972 RepID=A0ABX1P0V2_9CYAN|nr:hypothetical protein [Brasilonema bromeliae SPC951]